MILCTKVRRRWHGFLWIPHSTAHSALSSTMEHKAAHSFSKARVPFRPPTRATKRSSAEGVQDAEPAAKKQATTREQADTNVAESSLTTAYLLDKLPAATAKSSASLSAATQCTQNPQVAINVSEGNADGHVAVAIQVDCPSDTSDDKKTKKSTSKRADKDKGKRRVSYTVKQNCLVLHEILEDSGIFNRNEESKTQRWVKATSRVSEVLRKDIHRRRYASILMFLLKPTAKRWRRSSHSQLVSLTNQVMKSN